MSRSNFRLLLSNPSQISKLNAMATFYGSLNVYTFFTHPVLFRLTPWWEEMNLIRRFLCSVHWEPNLDFFWGGGGKCSSVVFIA